MKVVEDYKAPTPKKAKFWRNLFALIASIGVGLAPFTGGASGIVSIIALVANIIAGSKVLNEEDVAKMDKRELRELRDKLKDSTYGKFEGSAVDALALVEKELENKDRV